MPIDEEPNRLSLPDKWLPFELWPYALLVAVPYRTSFYPIEEPPDITGRPIEPGYLLAAVKSTLRIFVNYTCDKPSGVTDSASEES